MERPTCKTCPYWVNYTEGSLEPVPTGDGQCERHPPRWVGRPIDADHDTFPAMDTLHWEQPWTTGGTTCGEHPDFPAYLAARPAHPKSASNSALSSIP